MFSTLPTNVLQRLRNLVVEEPTSPAPQEASEPNAAPYDPTPIDIVVVRIMLIQSKKLPPDIVDAVFDHAEYWAHSSNEIDYQAEHQSALRIIGSSSVENKFLLRSFPVGLTGIRGKKDLAEVLAYDTNEAKPLPLGAEREPTYFAKLADYPTPKLIRPVRKVVFSFRSKDQGWGGDRENKGTYRGSWTWFEAGLERFDADQTCDSQCTYDMRFKSKSSTESALPVCGIRPVYPSVEPKPPKDNSEADTPTYDYVHPLHHQPKFEIQRNRTATKGWQDYTITWLYLDDAGPESEEARILDEEKGRGRATCDGTFVRDLKLGDVITVWGKARFGGWVNNVEKVKIDVYWAV